MKENNNRWVVCFSGYWDEHALYGIGNIILKFHEDNYKILWVNSMPNRNPSVKRAGSKKVLFKNINKKIKYHLKLIKKQKNNFYVLSPFYLPFVENPKIYKLNLTLLNFQIWLFKKLLNIKHFVVIASTTIETPYLFRKRKFIKYFHYVADLYSEYREASSGLKEKIRKREKRIFNFADYILVSSSKVEKKLAEIIEDTDKLIYFPHGVDYKHFHISEKKTTKVKLPFEKPIVGYFGSLTMANNQEVYLALADAGFSVVLIGRIAGDYSMCEKNENIYLLGAIPYEELPLYSNEFDIAIMAWKPSDWIDNSNPKKTYEYLAQGKPIVCNSIPEIKYQLSEFVYFADTPEEFVNQCKKALDENSEELITKRKEIALKVDWSNKYAQLKHLLDA